MQLSTYCVISMYNIRRFNQIYNDIFRALRPSYAPLSVKQLKEIDELYYESANQYSCN